MICETIEGIVFGLYNCGVQLTFFGVKLEEFIGTGQIRFYEVVQPDTEAMCVESYIVIL